MGDRFGMEGLWTYQQAAEFLGSTMQHPISERSIMRLCQERKLRRVYPIPKKPRIDPESVRDYVASLIADEYDENAKDGGQQIGAELWQKSTPAKIPRTGGHATPARMASQLENLLKSRKTKASKR